jgi:hypothetical protein
MVGDTFVELVGGFAALVSDYGSPVSVSMGGSTLP